MTPRRIAAIYDIHANLPALEAVLGEIRAAGVERIVVGGDVLPGPMPAETLDRLLHLEIPAESIYGNGEAAVLEALAGRDPLKVPESYRPVIRWNAQQLSAAHERLLRSWPKTVRIGEILFCHATPRDDNEIFTRSTEENLLLPIFDGLDAGLVVCGHTHMQFDRMIGKTRVVNAGSVGMPFGAPEAGWLLLDDGVAFRHTDYDLNQAAARIRETHYPGASDFAERYVRNPPSAEEMLKVFMNAALR